jgi:hypothetical protein
MRKQAIEVIVPIFVLFLGERLQNTSINIIRARPKIELSATRAKQPHFLVYANETYPIKWQSDRSEAIISLCGIKNPKINVISKKNVNRNHIESND